MTVQNVMSNPNMKESGTWVRCMERENALTETKAIT